MTILIQYYIIRIIDIIYTSNFNDLNNHKFKKKNKNKSTIKHNNKNMILGLELIHPKLIIIYILYYVILITFLYFLH